MDLTLTILKETNLFKHFSTEEFDNFLNNPFVKLKNYSKEETIFLEGDICNGISLIITGEVHIQQNNSIGNTLTISKLHPKNIFGENIMFSSDGIYTVDVVSKSNSSILHINKKVITEMLMNNEKFLIKFLTLLSNKSVILSSKLRQLNMKSLRERIATFLYSEYKKQNSYKIKLYSTKEELAKNFGVQRPSLSRELINMKNDGIINYDRKTITILDIDKLNSF